MSAPLHSIDQALAAQAAACDALGSPLYGRVLRGLAADVAAGGLTAELLCDRGFDRPLHDAVPLRLLGAVHRIVLRGDAPVLAARYPSAGGVDDGSDPTGDVLATMAAHRAEIESGLLRNVQTNEVGRCAALVVGFAAIHARHRLPLRLLELGSSSGLNLRWDRYWYDTGASSMGDARSAVRFEGVWEEPLPAFTPEVRVAARAGCDVAPLDPASPDDRLTLLSFVWPDQAERFARLRSALAIAAEVPASVTAADAGEWLTARLAERADGAATVVFHSIVWQYLPAASKTAARDALAVAGARASDVAPLAWLRLEPAGPVAGLRLTTWPGGEERLLATSSYHGPPVVGTRPES